MVNVTSAGETQTAEPGYQVVAAADVVPTEPEPYYYEAVRAAPVDLLPEPVSIPVVVPGTSDWVDSVVVTTGQTFTIVAGGGVNPCANRTGEFPICNGHGPEGAPRAVPAVDEQGNTITGDQIIAVCAGTLAKENMLKKDRVVTTVMSNKGLSKTFKKMGVEHIKTNVGDRYVLEEMFSSGAVLGGEDSGHIIFLDYHTSGDGILTGLQLLAAMLKEKQPLSELARIVTIYPQVHGLLRYFVAASRQWQDVRTQYLLSRGG